MSFGPPPSPFTQSALAAGHVREKRGRRLLGGALAAVLIAVLSLGGWLLWLTADDRAPTDRAATSQDPDAIRETVEKRPAGSTGHMGLLFSVDDLSPGETYETPGTWATDEILAKGLNRTLAGFKIGTDAGPGDEAWRTRLDGPICGTTSHVTVDGRTAVLFREHEAKKEADREDVACNQLALIDLNTGEKLWQKPLPKPASSLWSDLASVTMTHGTVAATWDEGSAAYDMRSGRRLWTKPRPSDCRPGGFAGGRALLLRLDCFGEDDQINYRVRKVNPRTGDTKWTYDVARGVESVYLLSTEPAVVALAAGDVEVTNLISLNGRGKHRATIRLEGGRYRVDCGSATGNSTVDDCHSAVVSRSQVFVTSREDPQASVTKNSNWIASFDLDTGKTVMKFDSGPNALLQPIRMSGGQLLAFRDSSDRITPYGLVSLNPRTGDVTKYFDFSLPVEGLTLTSPELADIVVEDGRIFFSRRSMSGPEKETDGKWIWGTVGIESARRGH